MPGSATDTQTAPPVPRHRSGSRRPRSSRPPDWSAGRSGTRSCRASCPPRPRPRRRPPGAARMGLVCRPRPSRCQVDAGHRAGVMVGDPQRPAPDGEALRAGAGPDRAVARRRPRWSRDRSQPPCCRRAPTGTCRLWSCWYAGEGDDRGEPFTDEAGTAAPVPVSAGGWVDRGVLPVSASPEHPAAASSTPMTNVFCQRPARSGDGPRLAGVGMAHLPSQGSRVGHPSYTGCAWPVPLEWKVSAGPRLPGVAPQP